MDNKTMLEGILWDLKSMSDLFMHGALESGTKNIHKAHKEALMDTLTMQNELYSLMSELGMYTTTNVPETKLSKAQNKFNPNLEDE